MFDDEITKFEERRVATYRTAASQPREVSVTTQDVYLDRSFIHQELHIRWNCGGCRQHDGIRAPFDEGDIATRQMQQQAREHADTCRL